MTEPSETRRARPASGALLGAAAWAVYAAVEYALWALVPRFERSYCSDSPLVWNHELALFALYPIGGAIVGALASVIIRRASPGSQPFTRSAADRLIVISTMAVLALASAGGVAAQFEMRGTGRAMFVAAMAVALGLLLVGIATPLGRGVRALGSPWLVSFVLLGGPAFATRVWPGDPRIPIYGLALLYLIATCAGLKPGTTKPDRDKSPLGSALRAALVGAGMVAIAWACDHSGYLYAPGLRSAAPTTNRPNIILIVMDTARAENLSVYGYERDTTPNLRRFAARATVYAQAIAPSNYTLSSHASLFTGLLPSTHGAYPGDPTKHVPLPAGGYGLADRFVTLAETLAARNYSTAAVISNYGFASEGYNLDQGFRRFVVQSYRCAAPSPRPLVRRWLDRWTTGAGRTWQRPPYDNAAAINEDVAALVDRLGRQSQRFLLFVNYMDVHWPYAPPPPFDTRFPGKDDTFDGAGYVDFRNAVLRGDRKVSDQERRHLMSQYDGGLAFLDQEIGKLLVHLEQRADYDESLVIITADHGEAFGDKGFVEHGTSLYQDQVHVPLIVKYPRERTPNVVREAVSLIDIMPTILGMLETDPPISVEGRSLLAGSMTQPRPVIAESFPRAVFRHLGHRVDRVQRAIIAGPLKLISAPTGERELYDLDRDPQETLDLYRPDNQAALELQKSLDGWLSSIIGGERGRPITDPETLERLKSLGYIK